MDPASHGLPRQIGVMVDISIQQKKRWNKQTEFFYILLGKSFGAIELSIITMFSFSVCKYMSENHMHF